MCITVCQGQRELQFGKKTYVKFVTKIMLKILVHNLLARNGTIKVAIMIVVAINRIHVYHVSKFIEVYLCDCQ